MGLPFSRERTYNDDTPVDPNDLNAIQDAICAPNNRPIHFGPHSWSTAQDAGSNSKVGSDEVVQFNAGAGFMTNLDLTPWLTPGATIKEITWRWFNGPTPTAGVINLTLFRRPVGTAGATVTIDNTVDDTDTGGADVERELTVAIGHVVVANNIYRLRVIIDQTGADDGAGLRDATVMLETP